MQYSKRYHWSSHDGMLEKQWNAGGMCAMPHQLSIMSLQKGLYEYLLNEKTKFTGHTHIQAENI